MTEKSQSKVAVAKRKQRKLQRLKNLEQMPVRMCSTDCRFRKDGGAGCDLFKKEQVKDGDDCEVEIRRINEWAIAFAEGNPDALAEDAGRLAASTYIMAMRTLEQILADGLTLTVPAFDRHGDPLMFSDHEDGVSDAKMVMITKSHPLWDPFLKLLRVLGMTPKEFGLSGKKGPEQPKLNGLIGEADQVTVQVVIAEQQEQIKAWTEGARRARELRQNDPVHARFRDQQDEGEKAQMERVERGLKQAGRRKK